MKSLKNIINWYFTKRMLPYWCIILMDTAIIFASGIFTYWLFNNGITLQTNFWPLCRTLVLYCLLYLVGFRIFHTYSGILRYSSFIDLQRIALSMLIVCAVLIPLSFVIKEHGNGFFLWLNVGETLSSALLAIFLIWSVRIIVKIIYDIYFNSEGAANTLIYGVQDGGVGLAKSIRAQKPAKFVLKGFITNDPSLNFHRLLGEKVYPVDDNLPSVIESLGIKAVLVSPKRNETFRNNTRLQDYIINSGAKIYMAQQAEEWIPGSGRTEALKEVNITDLLPRSQIEIDLTSIREALRGKRILITGSAGSIGGEIVRQCASFAPAEMVLIDQAETPQHSIRLMMKKEFPDVKTEAIVTSITNKRRMEEIFRNFKPDYVFHAAAYKHVPMMEDNPAESVQNNILGTKILADLSRENGVGKFVMISTDKAVNPTNVMGCSKRICEIYVQSLNTAEMEGKVAGRTQFVTTRFGNVLGSNGSVIPLFEEQIKAGGPVTVTDPNIIRYFMLIPEACKLVLEAGVKGEGGEIFVFDMGKPVRIADLAKRMISLSGVKGVEIKYIGLRKGEKLYEEVLSSSETTKPSFNDKIRIASVRKYDFEDVSKEIDELIEISETFDPMKIVAKMKEIVPEYKSQNSVYEVLDRQ